MLTDPISDYLNRIRNALLADHEEVEIPASRLKREMTASSRSRATSRTSASSRRGSAR
jgi:ribosomal protein S8